MKTVAFFNNKGGVGKTSLVYHLAWMFADLGKRVIVADLDPQSNLTSAFLSEDRLEELWSNGDQKTIFDAITPLIDGVGDLSEPHIEVIGDRLGLLPGKLSLSKFEDELSQQWPFCLEGKVRAFRVEACFWRLVDTAARKFNADISFIDVGPNLGAINRSALIASDHVVVPLAPDLYSLQGMKNLGPSLRDWRSQWGMRLDKRPSDNSIPLPGGNMKPSGYVLMRHSIRLDRPVKAYERWIEKMPKEYRSSVLGESDIGAPQAKDDPYCLGMMKDYRSLMPMALEANKPIFHLTAADGAMGAHYNYVQEAKRDFKGLAQNIAAQLGMGLP